MKIQFLSIGKPHEAYVRAGIDDFTKRINNYFFAGWKIISSPKNAASLSESELKKQEAKKIIDLLQPLDYVILLDENGEQLSSIQLANFIQQKTYDNCKQLIFLIGGAFGVDEKIKHRANFIWSLSQLVFPHMLVRLILTEQIYRACTILRNEKYHHI
ncbi:MAG: 23S rRNA (pseudouridine(1915)-N(3))-methyltransferase RlmH [Chitinophagaceae bacterium]